MDRSELSFAAIIGHDRPIGILKRALANSTLAHAYLFSGDSGVGKKLTARALAAAVNCAQTGPEGGCGVCPSCRKITGGGHPDVHIVASDGEEIKIDQIRQAQADLALKPFEGTKKILIVDGAENMNTASANAFLKTLEEPPGEALIVLITAMPHSLLPTIRSRCQEIRFTPLARRTLAQALVERRDLSEADARFLAALAKGSMGRGLEMDLEREKSAREELAGFWSALPQMSPADVLAQADAFSKDREQLEQLLDIGIEQLRDAIVLRETGDDALLVNEQGTELYRRMEQIPLQQMLARLELLTSSRSMLDRRVSGQLVAENLLLALAKE